MLSLWFIFLCMGLLPFAEALAFFAQPRCGGGRACVTTMASCEEGKCMCGSPYTWGKGDFNCYEDSELGCEIKNDPILTTYAKESEQFPFPCRYLVSHVRQDMIKESTEEVIGTCEAHIFANNFKAQGKFFVSSYDVALKLTYNNPHSIVESSFRQFGFADNNEVMKDRHGTNGQSSPFVPDGFDNIEYVDAENGVEVKYTWDSVNNRLMYWVSGCGIAVTLVPYDVSLKSSQKQEPGLAVSISKLHNPTFLSHESVTCLAPPAYGGNTIRQLKLDSLTRERSMLLRAFKADYIQNQMFGEGAKCSLISATLNDCQLARQRQAMKKCDWMLKEPHFLKCYDKSSTGDRILHLFQLCVEAWCIFRPCTAAIDAITVSGCTAVVGVAELDAFLAGNMCPEPENQQGGLLD